MADRSRRVRIDGPSRPATLCLFDDDWITWVVEDARTYYERDLLDAVRSLGARGVYVDVGAHCGNHSVFFALECPSTRVVAVEPRPATYAVLVASIEANGIEEKTTALQLAVHPNLREVTSYPIPMSRAQRRRMPCRTNTGRQGVRAPMGGEIVTPAVPLDALDVADVAVLKIDVEGMSVAALLSGRTLIERDRPAIAIESETIEARRRIHAFLSPLGYVAGPQYGRTRTHLWLPRHLDRVRTA